jgi:hypothetical protein
MAMCLKSPSHTKLDQFDSIPKVPLDVSTLAFFVLFFCFVTATATA